MHKWFFSLLFTTTALMADYTAQPIDQKLLDSKIKIIDIRTPSEWKTTGLVKGSVPIMFFNEQGNYDMNAFLNELNKKVKKGERFALICNSGNRSNILGTHFGSQDGIQRHQSTRGNSVCYCEKDPYRTVQTKTLNAPFSFFLHHPLNCDFFIHCSYRRACRRRSLSVVIVETLKVLCTLFQ